MYEVPPHNTALFFRIVIAGIAWECEKKIVSNLLYDNEMRYLRE